ncbi:outer membrane protein OmpA-like peptidoglycan-associated protein/ABC-type nitrate/sulfonate/bicarbonate transport system substrate-binding protein [Chitinivorax tropicus]|uniref:Outer membrane protein OmpA-like peptidoglycan-associated protein/ABC-type nitrate/sulfonate/bicarbonate transport system substrate-binding protein n=1 Tax=Chitinivorax tropicus TaxID=714531 RepID=A0A840MD88_9PROT|nr:phosphate ABC transporter substrate-binding/OmpA family protein [Chitinivorax tropicus]MBB5017274.1 outer membrane protein OmpA-like peptidoglycan-associated protein/ABC-type nitrate/sulfonate/bicarbonate transport system substrate-binding protein [Chitinivorax tropicus]
MARLTPLAKGLITVAVLGSATAVAWHFGLKDIVQRVQHAQPASGTEAEQAGAKSTANKAAPAAPEKVSGALGSAGNPLKVSIVSFHGYAPALVANGKSLITQSGSIFDQQGVQVKLVIQDDIPTLSTIFESKAAHCAWRTSDFWAQEQPNLRNAGLDARAVMVVDNTQGADAIITRDPAIKSVEDLAGRNIAMLQFTPSHGMVIDALDNSSLTARKKASVKMVFINAEEGTAGVRAALEAGNVDAAALWDPDLSLALKKIPGAKVVYSTKTASNLIYDVMVCDQRVLQNPANQAAIQGFVGGWMAGIEAAKAKPDDAVDALVNTEEFFALLAKDQGRPFIKQLFNNLVWTGLEDNARILGLAGGTNHYERVYRRFDAIYRAAGALANPKSPVIEPQDSVDMRYIKALLDKDRAAQQAAAKPEYSFSEAGREAAANKAAAVTKPVRVGFASGSAELTKRAQKTIDEEMVPFIENNGSAYFEISGNTDATGARDTNLRLSQARAQAVVNYLVSQWEFDRARFKIVGNGSDKPLCDERQAAAEELTVEECRALNRTTRTAVLTR